MEATVRTDSNKCPACGSDMVFDPEVSALKCEHCNHVEEIDKKFVSAERDFIKSQLDAEQWEDTKSFKCNNCGAVTTFQKNELSVRCAFCGAPHVMQKEEQPGIKPMGILPFSVSKKESSSYCKKWISKKFFAPVKLKKSFSPEEMNGVYIPCWSFDSHTYSTYTGRVGDYYTVTVGSGKNRHVERRIRWRNVSGSHARLFDDVVIEGSSHVTQKEYDGIAPFTTNSTVEYDGKYLEGFSAERYELGPSDAFDSARARMKSVVESEIRGSLRCDVVDYINVSTNYNDVKYKYILLPIWLSSYRYGKKNYKFVINGQTGKTYGKSPLSPFKVGGVVLLGLALIGLAAFLYLKYYNYI